MLFDFFKNKRTEQYLSGAADYCARILAEEEEKNKGAVKYSVRVDFGNDVKYSDRYYRPKTNAAVGQAINGAGDFISNYMNQSFSAQVESYIHSKGLTEAEVYKGAQLDRRLFSKIRTDHFYNPSKDTAIAVALALKLTLEEATELLSRAGYSLSHSMKRDIVFEYFFLNQVYSVPDINIVLDKLGLKTLGR